MNVRCYSISKGNVEDYICYDQGSQLQSPSIEYCYPFLNLLNRELAYKWIPPLVCSYFCSSGCPITCWYSFLSYVMKGIASQVSNLRTQYKEPWAGLESRPIDLECTTLTTGPLHYTSHNCSSQASEINISYCCFTWRCINSLVIQVNPIHIR